MRQHHRFAVLGALAALLLLAPAAEARHAPNVKPVHVSHGVTAGELLARSVARFYTATPPAGCERTGRDGEVLLLSGFFQTCTVDRGTQVVIGAPTNSCSDLEPEPFFAAAPDQLECAQKLQAETFGPVTITVNDGDPVTLDERFLVTGPQLAIVAEENNPFGAEARAGTFVAVGFLARLVGLRPGESYEVTVAGSALNAETGAFDPFSFSNTVVVTKGGRGGRG
jgi:hypothetical protein